MGQKWTLLEFETEQKLSRCLEDRDKSVLFYPSIGNMKVGNLVDLEIAVGDSNVLFPMKAMVVAMPISQAEAVDAKFPGVFTSDVFKKRKKADAKVPPRQAEIEETWDAFAKKNYGAARTAAEKASAMLK